MKFECNAWIELEPKMRGQDVIGCKIAAIYKRPKEGTIKLSISVPESFFCTPEIRVALKERNPEIWEGHEIEMSDAESGGHSR